MISCRLWISKTHDEIGRQYNIEMQMQGSSALTHRLLYYWARLHVSQLKEGDKFDELRPTISICFVNTVLFPKLPEYHLQFELRSARYPQVVFSNQQSMHLVQLPRLRATVEQLVGPMEAWCYFLIHGETLDTDNLPGTLRTALIPEAMETLAMISQTDLERERYEAASRSSEIMPVP